MQFIRSANELKMVHNEKYVEYYLKFQKKNCIKNAIDRWFHWSIIIFVCRAVCPKKKTNLKSASSLIGDKNSTEAFS